jgi:GNAT superfamily N-acetyltransferase
MSKELQIRDATAADARNHDTVSQPSAIPIPSRLSDSAFKRCCCIRMPACWSPSNTGDVGVLSLHFIPQLALAGFCRISYFCISDDARGQGIGALLEVRATELARARNCDG